MPEYVITTEDVNCTNLVVPSLLMNGEGNIYGVMSNIPSDIVVVLLIVVVMGMEVAITGVPNMVARIACSTCCNLPEGLNVVREKEYLPSMF